jgi:alkaline phosphatase
MVFALHAECSKWMVRFACVLLLCLPDRARAASVEPPRLNEAKRGNVIFLHPDGTSLSAWNAFRILEFGPDGMSQWDRMPEMALYRPHVTDSIAPTSHAGATIHGFGVKVVRDSYGQDGKKPVTSASGKPYSVMTEAIRAGIATGIVNSGHLAEPGTGALLASVDARANRPEIARQIIESGCRVVLGGGEVLFLPEGVVGRHGEKGIRKDGSNLIERAKDVGYKVVYTKTELEALPDTTRKVLGLFAAEATYTPTNEEGLRQAGIPAYDPDAPTVADMTAAALRFLAHSGEQFFLMVEEEGTDDFANKLNASGTFEAYRRADAMIGVARDFISLRDDTLLLMASDSDAGGMQAVAMGRADAKNAPTKVATTTEAGTPLDGVEGTGGRPFVSAPDKEGRRYLFGVAFISSADMFGGVIARAEGMNSELLPPHLDNTGIFRLIHRTLFAGK